MAAKKGAKKTGKRKSPARRKMSGIGGDTLKTYGGIMIGVVGGSMLAQKVAPTMDPKIKGGILAAGGLFVASKAKGGLMSGIGLGLSVAGGTQLLKGFGVISGIAQPYQRRIAGNAAQTSVMAGRGVNRGFNGETQVMGGNPAMTAVMNGNPKYNRYAVATGNM